MKRKSILLIFSLLFCLFLNGFVTNDNYGKLDIEKNLKIEKYQNSDDSLNDVMAQEDYILTVQDMALFLEAKREHYPLSDEFIERYQQTSGGYIDNASKAGLVVDRLQHEPNQKWHFFESWLYPSIEDGSLSWEEEAKSRVYNKLLCPELLLWIYEASEVDPMKVKNAKEVAEQAKVSNTHISTMAKEMRQCVPWEDIERTVLNYINSNVESFPVYVKEETGFSISGLKEEYKEGSEVTFTVNVTDTTKEIDEVKINDNVLKAVSGTKYSFIMPGSEVTISVILKDANPEVEKPDDNNETSYKYNIKYDLGTRQTAKIIETAAELYNTFEYTGQGASIINSISQMDYIYGGGYGGSEDNKWVIGDVLKFGTTKVNGSLTFALNSEVNQIKVTGYVSNNTCKIQVGDSESADWTGDISDNKTTVLTCSNMNETTKDIVENNQTSTIIIDFESTKNLRIAVTNKKPFYITSIEFIKSN